MSIDTEKHSPRLSDGINGGLNVEILIYKDRWYNVEIIKGELKPYAENKKYIKFDTREDMLDFVTKLILEMEG